MLVEKTWFSPFAGDRPQAIAFNTEVDLLESGLSDSISRILEADMASTDGDTGDLSVVGLLGIVLLVYFAGTQAGNGSSTMEDSLDVAGDIALKVAKHLSTKGAYFDTYP